MNDEEIKQLIASNAKAIEALTNDIAALKNEWQRDRAQLSQALENMAMGMTAMQREFINMQRRIDDNPADIRELAVENQRILRYLESIVNRTGDAK